MVKREIDAEEAILSLVYILLTTSNIHKCKRKPIECYLLWNNAKQEKEENGTKKKTQKKPLLPYAAIIWMLNMPYKYEVYAVLKLHNSIKFNVKFQQNLMIKIKNN